MNYRGELCTDIYLNKEVTYNMLLEFVIAYSKEFNLEIKSLTNPSRFETNYVFCVGLDNNELEFEIERKAGRIFITKVHICDHKENVTVEELKEKYDYIKELLN